jgi:hypothetical protein
MTEYVFSSNKLRAEKKAQNVKREPFLAQITCSVRMGKAPGFKLISLKGHQIWENQFHELNTYPFKDYINSRPHIFHVTLITPEGCFVT